MADKNGIGAVNHVLIQGRIAYGVDSTTGDSYPLSGTASGSSLVLLSDVRNTETIQTPLLAAQTIAASTNIISSTASVAGVKRATIFIDHARASTAAFTTNGTEYRIELSEQATGNDTWSPIASVLCSSAVCSSAAASSNCAAGTTLVTITSGTAMPGNDWIAFTSGTIEWVRSTVATGTASFNILDATTYGHASGTGIFSGAEKFVISLDVEAATRMRAIVNNIASAGTQPIASRIAYITEQ